jgi:hypothetical protein
MRAPAGTASIPRALVAALACGAVALGGCSALLDWGDYTHGGAAPDAGGSATEGGAGGGDAGGGSSPVSGPTCGANARCTGATPAGWTGPMALYEGDTADALPPCGQGFATAPVFEGNGSLAAPPAACAACACGPSTGGSCSAPMLTLYADDGCTSPCTNPVSLMPTTCATPIATCKAFAVADAILVGASCAASGGAPTVTPSSWGTHARACAPAAALAQGTCTAGELCAPAPAAPYPPRYCISRPGAQTSCPGEFTDGPHVYYADVVADTRACSPCTCSGVTGARCQLPTPAGFHFLDSSCSTPEVPFGVPTSCQALSTSQPLKIVAPPSLADAGSCAPAGGQPTGDVTPTGATTFCCAPAP